MFELGKDLKRLVAGGGRTGVRDARLLELIPTELVARQAHAEAAAAARAPRPGEAWRDVSRLWLEHARRTGAAASLEAAERAAERCLALGGGQLMRARAALMRHDLFGGPDALARAEAATDAAGGERLEPETAAQVAAFHARLKARRAQMRAEPDETRAAAALLDAALHGLEIQATRRRRDPWLDADLIETRLERAGLAAFAGVRQRDPRLLDQAGRDLRLLADRTDGDFAPLTRARALAACGAGLATLGEMADRFDCVVQALELIEAALDLFTADHSPMDHAAILAARGAALVRLARLTDEDAALDNALASLERAGRLTTGRRLKLGAEIAVLATRLRIEAAEAAGDLLRLSEMEARARARLASGGAAADPLGWAADQLALAEVYAALERLGAEPSRRHAAALARAGALDVLDEEGMADLV